MGAIAASADAYGATANSAEDTAIEEIIERIESGEMGLEEQIEQYARGAELLKTCREILERCEQRVEEISGELEDGGSDGDDSGS